MGQIRTRIKTTQPSNQFEKTLEQELLSFTLELAGLVNKGLKFDDNFNANILDISDSGAADSSNTVPHTLKRVPTGFIVININKAGVVYAAGTAWTETDIYLKCNVANCTIKILVF